MGKKDIEKPGELMIPPEIVPTLTAKIKRYDILDYEKYSKLDIIKDNGETQESLEEKPIIYLYGHTSEMHRWGVNLKETDFFKQVNKLKRCIEENRNYKVVVGVRRTNFHRLGDIYGFIKKINNQTEEFQNFSVLPLITIKSRFYNYLKKITDLSKKDKIFFEITDNLLDNFLAAIETNIDLIRTNLINIIHKVSEENSKETNIDLILNEVHNLNKLERFIELNENIVFKPVLEKNAIYLYGYNEFMYKTIGLRPEHLKESLEEIKYKFRLNSNYKIVIGLNRQNFYKINDIIELIKTNLKESKSFLYDVWNNHPLHKKIIKGINKNYKLSHDIFKPTQKFPELTFENLKNIRELFYNHLFVLRKNPLIEFQIIDTKLDEFLRHLESTARQLENNFLKAIGPVCKDVFTGPKFILFNLNGTCNTDCVYCRRFSPFIDKKIKEKRDVYPLTINFDVVENVLKDAQNMGVERILLVGEGEPTMYPHFKEVIKDIKDNNLTFNLSTNGSLINKYLDELTNGTCNTITISMSWATEKSFSKIRPGTTKKHIKIIEENVKKLSDLKKKKKSEFPNMIILHAISSYNYFDIINMAKQAVRLGADTIWYQLTHLEDFSEKELYMNEEQMKQAKKDLHIAKKICEENKIHFASFIDYELEHYHEEKGDWSVNALLKEGCHVGWHFTYIDLDSIISFCCGMRKILFIKKGEGLKKAWYSDTYRRYRNDGLIMHKENPVDLFGKPLYGSFCESCDNHDQNTFMIGLITDYGLNKFVER